MLWASGYGMGRLDGHRAAYEPRVEIQDDSRLLLQGSVGVQTVSKLDGGSTGLYYDWAALVGVFTPEARRVVMLGLGGGEMLRVLKRTVPKAALSAVEIDDRVIVTALRDFPENVESVTVIEADAARWVAKGCGQRVAQSPGISGPLFDAIIVDVYDGPEMPEHFTESTFYSQLHRCLTPRGMVIVNARDRELAKVLASALHLAGFGDVVAFPVLGTPSVILWAVRKDDWGQVSFPDELVKGMQHRWKL